MTEHDKKILDLIEESVQVIKRIFKSDDSRSQLMENKEAIQAYKSYLKNSEFKNENLKQLELVNTKLENQFILNWNYDSCNPYGQLKYEKVYSSQTQIIVEWHAGNAFHHLYRYHLLFYKDGFMTITAEKPIRSKSQIIDRIKSIGKDYNNLYEVEKDGSIKFKLRNEIFEGALLHDGIVGKKIKLGEYKDGLVEDQDEIFVIIE